MDQLTIPPEYRDRAATAPEITQAAEQLIAQSELKPIAIAVTAQEIGTMFAAEASPYAFGQFLLERFKNAGAPVEGVLKFKLREGQIARVKPELADRSGAFKYVWLPPEYVTAVTGWSEQSGFGEW